MAEETVRVLIVEGRFYSDLSDELLRGATSTLEAHGVQYDVVSVPGALEIPAIIFGGAAVLLVGRALLLPGSLSRGASLRRVLPSVWRIIIGAALTLICAGIIEGSFSQFSAKTIPYALKISVALLLFVGLTTYLFLRRADE